MTTDIMTLSDVESRLRFIFPEKHRQAIQDPDDPIHEACDFLALSDKQCETILDVNESLRSPGNPNPWPDFLIAFASNGCGDYFAYDTRNCPATIIYIDPDLTVEENLQSGDKLCYAIFEEWYDSQFERPRFLK